MDLKDILAANAVRSVSVVASKKRLLQDLAEQAASAYELSADDVFQALQERESLGPTGVGKGIALPHARLPGLDKVVGVFLRLEKPLEFGAADRQPVDLFFCLLAPAQSGVDHLKALARVSRTFRNEAVCQKLRSTSDVGAIHAILTDEILTKAA